MLRNQWLFFRNAFGADRRRKSESAFRTNTPCVRLTFLAVLTGLFVVASFSPASAQESEDKRSKLSKLLRPKLGRLDLDPRSGFFDYSKYFHKTAPAGDCQLQRAGNPHCYAPWARCQDDRRYVGYYVGGGAAFGGDRRCPHEGTWGWDYKMPWAKVNLGWFHGRRYQGGEGQYNPDTKNDPGEDFSNP